MRCDSRDQVIAESLEAAGFPELAWRAAAQCPQGHRPPNPQIGALCPVCMDQLVERQDDSVDFLNRADVEQYLSLQPASYSAAWRFAQVPQPFHLSLDLAVAALNALEIPWECAPRASGLPPAAIAESLVLSACDSLVPSQGCL